MSHTTATTLAAVAITWAVSNLIHLLECGLVFLNFLGKKIIVDVRKGDVQSPANAFNLALLEFGLAIQLQAIRGWSETNCVPDVLLS